MEEWQSLLERFLRNECTVRENKIVYHALRDGLIDEEFRYAIDVVMNDPDTVAFIDRMKPVPDEALVAIRDRLKRERVKPVRQDV